MDMPVDVAVGSDAGGEREGPRESMAKSSGAQKVGGEEQGRSWVADVNSPISPLRLESPVMAFATVREGERVLRVRDFSRLWLYRNGGVPPDDGLRRAFTT